MTHYLGIHVLLELYGCPAELLCEPVDSEQILRDAAVAMGASIVEARFHAFSPHGVSGVVVIAESHLTVHTWPEHGYAAVDVFSCGKLNLEAGLTALREGYSARSTEERTFQRGRLPTSALRKG